MEQTEESHDRGLLSIQGDVEARARTIEYGDERSRYGFLHKLF